MDAKPVIFLMGPTASGKTALAMELAQRWPMGIISVDSAMIYRTMTIGTAKPTPEQLKQVPHRLIDIRDPIQHYSAGEFRREALAAIEDILGKNRLPLLVGGTMLYFHVLQQGIAPLPKANQAIRQQLQDELEKQGLKKLYVRLQQVDPVSAQRIHPHDPQRLLRALEIFEITGKTRTEIQQSASLAPLPYRVLTMVIAPNDDRSGHHQLIENRFQNMLQQGFIEEVQQLFHRGDLHAGLPSMRTVGYRQLWCYLQGQLDYNAMRERALIATRQLAKRQMTWLRSWNKAHRLILGDKANISKSITFIKTHLAQRL